MPLIPLVLLIPVANLPQMSSVNETGGNLIATDINETSGKFSKVSTTPVVHLELRNKIKYKFIACLRNYLVINKKPSSKPLPMI